MGAHPVCVFCAGFPVARSSSVPEHPVASPAVGDTVGRAGAEVPGSRTADGGPRPAAGSGAAPGVRRSAAG